MYEIHADLASNCLYITLKGFMKAVEGKEAADRVISESDKLQAGFCVVNDIHEFKPGDAAVAEQIKRAQGYIFKKGVNKVVRIVGDAVLGGMQFRKTQQDAHVTYKTFEVGTKEEATQLILDGALD